MADIQTIGGALSIREQAAAEVKRDLAEVAKGKYKALFKQQAAAEAVLQGINLQLADLDRQVEDGTVPL